MPVRPSVRERNVRPGEAGNERKWEDADWLRTDPRGKGDIAGPGTGRNR